MPDAKSRRTTARESAGEPRSKEAREAGSAPAAGAFSPREGDADDAERALGRVFSIALPVVCLTAAVLVGFLASAGSAFLVLASGTLIGAIALLWASLRTLSGDAPLPSDMREIATLRSGVDDLAERKRRALRALKDLENEHALGRLDDADYAAVMAKARDEAKSLMREIDDHAAPTRLEAEKMARDYLARRGLAADPGNGRAAANGGASAIAEREARVACAGCGASNEADATFCKSCGSAVAAKPKVSDATR